MTLRIHQLAVGYNTPLIEPISMSIEKPSLVAIIGENGSGKSTFLKTLCGVQKPLDGVVYVNEKQINTLPFKERTTHIFYLPSGRIFSPSLTVLELFLLAKNDTKGFSFEPQKESDLDRTFIEELDIKKLLSFSLSHLSDGQYQIVAIVFCLLKGASILLLDEPFSFLDYKNKVSVFNFIKQLVKTTGNTIVFTTHDLQFINNVDELWKLENKILAKMSTTDIELLRNENTI